VIDLPTFFFNKREVLDLVSQEMIKISNSFILKGNETECEIETLHPSKTNAKQRKKFVGVLVQGRTMHPK
jgi:hypothetical protein